MEPYWEVVEEACCGGYLDLQVEAVVAAVATYGEAAVRNFG